MNRIFGSVQVGRKNIVFGMALFLVLGVVIGVPLTVDLMGGSMLTDSQYQAWKVLHAYGVFLAFVNFFFGYCVDRLNVSKLQQEIASWAFIVAGIVGALGRSALVLLSASGGLWSYAISLIETLGFVVGTFIFIRSQLVEKRDAPIESPLSQVVQ
jgi:hypothetical protein